MTRESGLRGSLAEVKPDLNGSVTWRLQTSALLVKRAFLDLRVLFFQIPSIRIRLPAAFKSTA